MTGRELIIYILSNNLENAKVFEDGSFLENLFMSEQEAASKFGVGVATVKAWVDVGILKGVCYGGSYFIPKDSEPRFTAALAETKRHIIRRSGCRSYVDYNNKKGEKR